MTMTRRTRSGRLLGNTLLTLTLLDVGPWVPGAAAQEVGPARGSLVIVGGGAIGDEIYHRFFELAGGTDAPIVVIPTAGTNDDEYDQFYRGLSAFRRAGATNLTVLHTRNREQANTDVFVQAIRGASGVFFEGGRQWRLADAYLGTKVETELRALLDRGGVIGGTSAGATIQGDYLVRGDTKGNEIMMGDHEKGFAFLRGVAIDQHVLKRNRQFDLLEVIEKRPDLLGIAIDESTAIVVQGDEFRVIGESYALIFDPNRQLATGGPFYFLAPGDRFDLKTREAFRPNRSERPVAPVVPKRASPR
jgi:cyanophycinase